ncbi:MAG: hypothetical protein A4E62_01083 [Syntrophorhabdus sp. PtaU1.Bin002]|nr:MAG: hypothetical protein A4E62_01083 [Syntrophorhabdus sp. PtaU1.Bin002]
MSKTARMNFVQHLFACVAEGCMAEIVPEGNGLHEIFIQG